MPPNENKTVGFQMRCEGCGNLVLFPGVETGKIKEQVLVCPDCSYFNPIDKLKEDGRLTVTSSKPNKKKG